MAHRPPTFSGNPEESVIAFIEDMKLYAAARTLNEAQEGALLIPSIRGQAKAAYDTAIAAGAGAGGIGAALAAGVAAPATAASNTATYTWLRAQFHTADIQQQLKDKLLGTYQEEGESPTKFYSRIREIVQYAGYADAAMEDLVAENTFMQGVLPKYSFAIRTAPATMTLNQRVEYAQKIWSAGKPIGATSIPLPRAVITTEASKPAERTPISETEPKADPVMDKLAEEFAKMTAHIANLEKRINYRQPVQRFDQRRHSERSAEREERTFPRRPPICYRCGEEGHLATDCMTETSRKAQPSNFAKRNSNRPRGSYVVQEALSEDDYDWNSEDEEKVLYVPALSNRKPGRPPKKGKTPYERPKRKTAFEEEASSKPKETFEMPEFANPFDSQEESQPEDMEEVTQPPKSESPSREEKKFRKSKTYDYNAWEDVKDRTPNITFKQLAELNPKVKMQIREGLAQTKPGWEVIEINQTTQKKERNADFNRIRDSESDSDNDDTKRTSAYTICRIENLDVETIIDTGSGGCIITKTLLDRLGWKIDAPTRMTIIVADGIEATPIGKVKDIPVRFGEATIPTNAIVIDSHTYEFIIGNKWLEKAKAVIDFPAEKMKITWRDRTWKIPININKGIRPEMEEEDREDKYFAIQSTRRLTREEQIRAYDRMLQDERCAFCNIRVYCSEDSCNCPILERIPITSTLDQEWESRRRPTKARVQKKKFETTPYFPYDTKGWMKEKHQGIHWSCTNDCQEAISLWEEFWKTAPNVGRGKFYQDRDIYDRKSERTKKCGRCPECRQNRRCYKVPRGAYWDEVDPNDFLTTLHQNEIPEMVYVVQQQKQPQQELKYVRVNPEANRLQQLWPGDAGYDLQAMQEAKLQPGETYIMPTGIAVKIPEGNIGIIKPRSSLAKEGLTIDGGVIDEGFTGEIQTILVNRNHWMNIKIEKGDRISQLLIMPRTPAIPQEVQKLPDTKRGKQGFGSTGFLIMEEKKKSMDPTRKDEAEKENKHTYKLGEKLTTQQKQELRKLMKEFEDVFSTQFKEIAESATLFRHDIDTGDNEPIKQPPRRLPPAHKEWVKEETDRLMKGGIIRRSNSPWASPIVMAPKKEIVINKETGERTEIIAPRFCIDYRRLNKITGKTPTHSKNGWAIGIQKKKIPNHPLNWSQLLFLMMQEPINRNGRMMRDVTLIWD
jgi:dUTP pyrophosphatase